MIVFLEHIYEDRSVLRRLLTASVLQYLSLLTNLPDRYDSLYSALRIFLCMHLDIYLAFLFLVLKVGVHILQFLKESDTSLYSFSSKLNTNLIPTHMLLMPP